MIKSETLTQCINQISLVILLLCLHPPVCLSQTSPSQLLWKKLISLCCFELTGKTSIQLMVRQGCWQNTCGCLYHLSISQYKYNITYWSCSQSDSGHTRCWERWSFQWISSTSWVQSACSAVILSYMSIKVHNFHIRWFGRASFLTTGNNLQHLKSD